jgi:hypothetical protein
MSFLSRLTRKANTSQMETIHVHPLFEKESADLNTKYQTAYKKYVTHKSPEINSLMTYINRGIRMLNGLVNRPSSQLNKDIDTRFVHNVTDAMKTKLDFTIPPLERREKYNELRGLIFDLDSHYTRFVIRATGTIVSGSRNQFQRNLSEYTNLFYRNATTKLNATSKASKAAANNTSVALASAETRLGSRLNAENVKRSAVMKTTGAVTGMYNNGPGPTAGVSNNEVEAYMRNLAAKAAVMPFPEVPTHPVVGRRGGRRTRRARHTRRRV